MHRSVLAIGALISAFTAPGAVSRPRYIEVELIAGSAVPKAGRTILVGLRMTPRSGWHGYWSNPGESGLAPTVRWSAPRGVRFGALEHPAPTLLRVMGMSSYVHAGPHVLITRMTVDPNLPRGTALPITADISWAACSDRLCVPEKARLSLRLKVGNGSPSGQAALLRAALARAPKRLAGGSFRAAGNRIVLTLPASARLQPSQTRFFPDENGYWHPLKTRVVSAKPITIVGLNNGSRPIRVSGVASDGSAAYRLNLKMAPAR